MVADDLDRLVADPVGGRLLGAGSRVNITRDSAAMAMRAAPLHRIDARAPLGRVEGRDEGGVCPRLLAHRHALETFLLLRPVRVAPERLATRAPLHSEEYEGPGVAFGAPPTIGDPKCLLHWRWHWLPALLRHLVRLGAPADSLVGKVHVWPSELLRGVAARATVAKDCKGNVGSPLMNIAGVALRQDPLALVDLVLTHHGALALGIAAEPHHIVRDLRRLDPIALDGEAIDADNRLKRVLDLVNRVTCSYQLRLESIEKLASDRVAWRLAIGAELELRPVLSKANQGFRPPVCGVRVLVLVAQLPNG